MSGTPKQGYFLKDGTKVPSVTTILGARKDCGGLIHWAWNLGKQGVDYRDVRDAAAKAGTLAHDMVEAYVHGETIPSFDEVDPVEVEKAEKAFEAFKEWADQTQLVITHSEIQLVSETYKYGGTPDAILVKGKRALGDWKTSNAVYPEYLMQLAAYGKLWEENFPDEPITGGFHLIRFDKEYGDFHHRYWSELDAAWRGFLILREMYDIDRELKARCR